MATAQIPNFAEVPLAGDIADSGNEAEWDASVAVTSEVPVSELSWLTPEGIELPPVLTKETLSDLDFLDGYPGVVPFLRGPYPTM
ncbi:MAG TPA: methylmalonyl-CoA mutase family protein, partial [Acidimicrobiales bacterium]